MRLCYGNVYYAFNMVYKDSLRTAFKDDLYIIKAKVTFRKNKASYSIEVFQGLDSIS